MCGVTRWLAVGSMALLALSCRHEDASIRADPVSSTPAVNCAPTEQRCDDKCVALESDANHCGACGQRCRKGEACALGLCAAPANWTTTAISRRCSEGSRYAY